VECEDPVPPDVLQLGHEVRMTLVDQPGVLPLVTRLVRVTPGPEALFVLQIPAGTWLTNRRAFFRAEFAVPVVLVRADAPVAAGHTLNVSGGGALLETEAFLEIREEFQLVLHFEQDSLGCKARVMWARYTEEEPSIYGVMFVDIPRRDQNRLCRMVQCKEFEMRRNEIKELSGRNAGR
jgi:c-di-GMP-binding flagellar brake protein YcgR